MSLFEKTIDTEIISNFVSIGLQWLFLTKFIENIDTTLGNCKYIRLSADITIWR